MPVEIGTVTTFPHPKADKSQVLKIAEEEHEVFSAWERWRIFENETTKQKLIDEAADLITATCNLLAALGVDDMRGAMKDCEERNQARGRL